MDADIFRKMKAKPGMTARAFNAPEGYPQHTELACSLTGDADFLAPILLFCFGTGGIVLSIVLLLDGEFENSPWLAIVGVAIGIVLIVIGAMRLKQVNTKNKYVTKNL